MMTAEIVVRCAEVVDVCAIVRIIPNWYGGTDPHSSVHHIYTFLQMKNQNPFVMTVDETVVSFVNARHAVSDTDH